jgi:hypothetical protein
MSAAERQRRRRARLRSENPSKKPGRPRLGWLPNKSDAERLCLVMKHERWKAASLRRAELNHQYASFGAQVLGMVEGFPDYSVENVERFKPIAKKGILELFGRYLLWLTNECGHDVADAVAHVRAVADDMVAEDPFTDLALVKDYFRWLRADAAEREAGSW